jgi:hypothetical protein
VNAPLEQLTTQLGELSERPLAAHPDVLDELHRALVGELDTLAGDRAH